MCKSACEGSCSTEIAAECPILQVVQKLSPNTDRVLDDTWKKLGIAMEREEASLPLARILAKNMI